MNQTQTDAKPHDAQNSEIVQPAALSWSTAILLFWPVMIAGAVLDLWSKWAVFQWLEQVPQQRYSLVDGYIGFILRVNDGAAFSMFRGWTFFLVGISVVALVVVLGIFFSRKIHSRLLLFALGCMAAGIVGNLYDRVFNDGKVRDFIDVVIPVIDYSWPTFNVADSLLCIGVGLMVIVNFRATASEKHAPEQKEGS